MKGGRASSSRCRVLIAGGGTGGHVFPALALASAFQRLGAEVRIAGSRYGLETKIVPRTAFRLYTLPIRGLYRVPWRRRLVVFALLPFVFLRALGILLSYRPHLVLGVGGYASAPLLATAILCRIPSFIQEQNRAPGVTNRLLGRFVERAFVPARGLERFFRRVQIVASPVRQAILALRTASTGSAARKAEERVLLVLGGSQGARALNEAFIEATPALETLAQALPVPLRIVHQCGPAALDALQTHYARSKLCAKAHAFIDDIAAAYAEAHLIVSRSGASATAEIMAARRVPILIPIPASSGDHQLQNARHLASRGAAWLLEQGDLDGDSLAGAIRALLLDDQRRERMEKKTDSCFPGDTAVEIACQCLAACRRCAVRLRASASLPPAGR